MKNTTIFLLGLFILLVSCEDDEPVQEFFLNYDGDNVTAPYLEAGVHEAAARFRADRTGQYEGQFLNEVEFYLLELPTECEIRVYGPGTASSPGDLLYSQNVTNNISASSWNTHQLTTPVEITGGDLWICVRLTHSATNTTIGCDAGPTNPNGDWLYSDSDSAWLSFRDRTSQAVSINWNIRGKIGE